MNPSGPFKRRLIFPMLEFNPLMPSRPGDSGLLYTLRHEILSDGPWTLFGKLSSEPFWDYLGEYNNEICGKMTAVQFANLPKKVPFLHSFSWQRLTNLCRCSVHGRRRSLKNTNYLTWCARGSHSERKASSLRPQPTQTPKIPSSKRKSKPSGKKSVRILPRTTS